MKTHHRIALFIFVSVLSLAGCRKDKVTTTTSDIKNLFSQTGVQSQNFTINAGQYQQITGAKGTRLTFSDLSLLDASGNPVTGSVQIELKEIYDNSDMVFSNATTTSNGNLLLSGGEVYFKARKNGQELHINPNQPVLLQMPAADNTPMNLFLGQLEGSADSIQVLNWQQGTAAQVWQQQDTIGGGGGVAVFNNVYIDSCTWINTDVFYSQAYPFTQFTEMHIVLPNDKDLSNTKVFQVFTDYHSVNGYFQYDEASHTLSCYENQYHLIPLGVNMTVVAISEINGKYYSSIVPLVVTDNMTINLTFTETTLDNFKTAVNSL